MQSRKKAAPQFKDESNLFHRVIDLTESDGVLNGDVAICELILGQHLYYQQQICKNCKNFDQTIKVEANGSTKLCIENKILNLGSGENK